MTDKPPAERPPEEPTRRFWELDPGEQRTMWITIAGSFVGGVASIVVGAAAVGTALAFGRLIQELAYGVIGAAVLTVIFTAATLSSLTDLRHDLRDKQRLTPIDIAWTIGPPALAMTFLLFAWIGVAAGVGP